MSPQLDDLVTLFAVSASVSQDQGDFFCNFDKLFNNTLIVSPTFQLRRSYYCSPLTEGLLNEYGPAGPSSGTSLANLS